MKKVLMKAIKGEIKHFQQTGIPRCTICHKPFIKVKCQSGKYHSTWRPSCEHARNLRLCVG